MITNDPELEVVRQQRNRVDAILASLRDEFLPKSERMYNLFAESWIDMRQELQTDLDAYLRAKAVPANGSAGAVEPAAPKALTPTSDDRAGGNQIT
jgi:hypothetical protein